MKKPSINYGKKDLLEKNVDFIEKEAKFRVTMYLDMDLLKAIRKKAKRKGISYQTYINMHLRESHFDTLEDEKIRKIVKEELEKKAK